MVLLRHTRRRGHKEDIAQDQVRFFGCVTICFVIKVRVVRVFTQDKLYTRVSHTTHSTIFLLVSGPGPTIQNYGLVTCLTTTILKTVISRCGLGINGNLPGGTIGHVPRVFFSTMGQRCGARVQYTRVFRDLSSFLSSHFRLYRGLYVTQLGKEGSLTLGVYRHNTLRLGQCGRGLRVL